MSQSIVSSSVPDEIEDETPVDDRALHNTGGSNHVNPLDEDVSDSFAAQSRENLSVVRPPSPLMGKIGPLPGWAWLLMAVAVLGVIAMLLATIPKPVSPFTDAPENMATVAPVGESESPIIGGGFDEGAGDATNGVVTNSPSAGAPVGETMMVSDENAPSTDVSNDPPTAQAWDVVALSVAEIKTKMESLAKRQSELESAFSKQMSALEHDLDVLQKKAVQTPSGSRSKPIPQKQSAPKTTAKSQLSGWSVSAINEGEKAIVVSPDGQKHMVSVGDEIQGVVVKAITADHIKTTIGVLR